MSKKGSYTFADTLFNSAFIHNPVLFQMVGLGAVVAVATTLKTSVLLAAVFFPVMVITQAVACLFLKSIPRWIRVTLYLAIGTAIVAPVMHVIDIFDPSLRVGAGIYLGLTAVSSITALHCEKFAVKMDIKRSLFDAVACAAGYGIVIIVVGLLRELFGMASIWGKPVSIPFTFPAFLMPFGGFIVLAFCAAALKALINKRFPEHAEATALEIKKTTVIVSKKDLPDEEPVTAEPSQETVVQAEEESEVEEVADEPETDEEAKEQEDSEEDEAVSPQTVEEEPVQEVKEESEEAEESDQIESEIQEEPEAAEVFEPQEQVDEFEPIAPMVFEQEAEASGEYDENIDDVLKAFEKREFPESQTNSDDDEFSSLLNHLFELVEFDSKPTEDEQSEEGEDEK